ncbi:LysR family transcriptional regulator [Diaphorobacter aerolatus]|uniref:LysR family transcriptional regulator n=1 Tax=Diaphorobacter aerolatus TaxID=1288495 RepID=A0A7H0GNN2_9BURK|nr:LysR family transcriptional regulator [Diaphorobacter aerolatus]QNP49898.1 LysR family transcriptional regulator [Diaphorobacter aerolatus]
MSANVNLKLLQTFMLVAELKSFRKAAESSNRTPSAVSMQVKQLEDQTGLTLLRRTTRSVELTLEGAYLLEKTRQALTDLDHGLLELRDAAVLRQGLISLASSPTVACTLLPNVLARFGKAYPRVTVRLREVGLEDILKLIQAGEVDFGIGPATSNATDFEFTTLLHDPLCALVPRTHPLAKLNRLSLADLAGVPCVMLSSFAAVRKSVDAAARTAGVRLNVQYEVQQMQTLIAMAAEGLGIGIAPKIAAETAAQFPLKIINLTDDGLIRDISIINVRGRALSPVAQQLLSYVREAI